MLQAGIKFYSKKFKRKNDMLKNNFKKVFFCFVLVATIFTHHTALAASPEKGLDQRCFTKKQCAQVREDYKANPNEDGFVTGKIETSEACPGKSVNGDALGFCLPPGKTKTSVSFGGRSDFENMGDFIQYGYRYGIIFAGILAILMIVVAGFQWTASGGNSSTIESAKKKISGALTGLILAASSYLILNTINPSTVNLRLPQTWMVNTIGIAPQNCTEAPDGSGIKIALTAEDSIKPNSEEIRQSNLSAGTWEAKTASSLYTCGNQYYVEGSGNMTCRGSSCEPKHVCFQEPNAEMPSCVPGSIAGIISDEAITDNAGVLGDLAGNQWNFPWIKSIDEVIAVCKNGRTAPVSASRPNPVPGPRKTQSYKVTIESQAITTAAQNCETAKDIFENQLKGFVLEVEMTESGELHVAGSGTETHYLGRTGSTAVDLGDSTFFNSDYIPYKIRTQYFFTEKELRNGIVVNIDATKIHDMDFTGNSTSCLFDVVTLGLVGNCGSALQETTNDYKQAYGHLIGWD